MSIAVNEVVQIRKQSTWNYLVSMLNSDGKQSDKRTLMVNYAEYDESKKTKKKTIPGSLIILYDLQYFYVARVIDSAYSDHFDPEGGVSTLDDKIFFNDTSLNISLEKPLFYRYGFDRRGSGSDSFIKKITFSHTYTDQGNIIVTSKYTYAPEVRGHSVSLDVNFKTEFVKITKGLIPSCLVAFTGHNIQTGNNCFCSKYSRDEVIYLDTIKPVQPTSISTSTSTTSTTSPREVYLTDIELLVTLTRIFILPDLLHSKLSFDTTEEDGQLFDDHSQAYHIGIQHLPDQAAPRRVDHDEDRSDSDADPFMNVSMNNEFPNHQYFEDFQQIEEPDDFNENVAVSNDPIPQPSSESQPASRKRSLPQSSNNSDEEQNEDRPNNQPSTTTTITSTTTTTTSTTSTTEGSNVVRYSAAPKKAVTKNKGKLRRLV